MLLALELVACIMIHQLDSYKSVDDVLVENTSIFGLMLLFFLSTTGFIAVIFYAFYG